MDQVTHQGVEGRANSTNRRRRFLVGAMAVGLPVYVMFTLAVVSLDTQAGGLGNALFPAGANLASQLAIIVPAAIAFVVGWRLRGSAIIGAAAGATVGWVAASPTSDTLARAIDPSAVTPSLLEPAGIGILLLQAAATIAVVVAGSIGWGIWLALRGRRYRFRTQA